VEDNITGRRGNNKKRGGNSGRRGGGRRGGGRRGGNSGSSTRGGNGGNSTRGNGGSSRSLRSRDQQNTESVNDDNWDLLLPENMENQVRRTRSKRRR